MSKKELVFIPTPGMGHLLSTVEFAKLLIKHDQRISVLVIVFHMPVFNSTNVEAYVESQSNELDPNRIAFLTLPPLLNPPDPAIKDFYRTVIELHKPLVEQSIANRQPKINPMAFVLDMLCVTMIDIANQFHVPSYVYFTSGANLLNLMLHFQSLVDDKNEEVLNLFRETNAMLNLPGFKNLVPTKVLPTVFLDNECGWYSFVVDITRKIRKVKGVLINTFEELEPYAIQALVDQLASDGNNLIVYPVGPVLALDDKGCGGASKGEPEDHDQEFSIIKWLDEQPSSSVVFLCFGSMGSFDEEQVKEIANGLDRSGYRFLWSLRRPPQQGKFGIPSEHGIFEDALPEAFLDRMAHRGKVIGWAPQVSILAHRAIGGFVSHCGWNSILESLWFGVPIATWPLYSEQQMNAFELINELGLAVEVRMDYRRDVKTNKANFTVKADEVESGIKKLMILEDKTREKVNEMKDKSRKAVASEEPSYNSLTLFVEEVLRD